MGLRTHLEEFAGVRVREFVTGKGIIDPLKTAYRIAVDYDSNENWEERFFQFASDPNIGKLRYLVVGQWSEDGSTGIDESLELIISAAAKMKNLQGLFLGDIIQSESEISWIQLSDISAVWPAFPKLRHFGVRGNAALSLGSVQHEQLRTLTIESGGLPVDVVRQVAASELPRLEHLELWLGDDEYGGDATVDDVTPLLSREKFPKLKKLGIRNFRFADQLAEKLAGIPFIKQLRELDLSLGTLTDVGGKALLASPAILKLKKLNLQHHYMSEEMAASLAKLPPDVDISDRQNDEKYGRYVAVSE